MTEKSITRPPARVGQIILPGQVAAADGPLDMTMMYVMHHAFRRDLQALAEAASATPLSDRRVWRALARRWDVFAYTLHHHHSGEDEGYWPLLAARVDDADRATLAAMEAEHAEIDPLLERCRSGFGLLSERGSEVEHAALVEALEEANDRLSAHLAHEETEAIPLLQRHVTPAEDERIEVEHFRSGVPLRRLLQVVPWAMHQLPEGAQDAVFATTGSAYRWLWLLTRRGFDRQDRMAMRHV